MVRLSDVEPKVLLRHVCMCTQHCTSARPLKSSVQACSVHRNRTQRTAACLTCWVRLGVGVYHAEDDLVTVCKVVCYAAFKKQLVSFIAR